MLTQEKQKHLHMQIYTQVLTIAKNNISAHQKEME